MSTSMTKGSPLKLMLSFALPLLAGNLLQQTYNIIDAAIVGQVLGSDTLASVGASSSVPVSRAGLLHGKLRGLRGSLANILAPEIWKKCAPTCFMGRC